MYMKKAIVAGNHLITEVGIVFEEKPLSYSKNLLDENADLIISFDQINVKTLDVVDSYKSLPLVAIDNFFRKEELPEFPIRTRLIFENSLRNYSRAVLKNNKPSALTKNMFNDHEDHIKCSCVAIIISLVEILFKRYDEVILIADKESKRLRQSDLLKVKMVIPELQIVWV